MPQEHARLQLACSVASLPGKKTGDNAGIRRPVLRCSGSSMFALHRTPGLPGWNALRRIAISEACRAGLDLRRVLQGLTQNMDTTLSQRGLFNYGVNKTGVYFGRKVGALILP